MYFVFSLEELSPCGSIYDFQDCCLLNSKLSYETFVLEGINLLSEVLNIQNTAQTVGEEPQGHKNNFSLGKAFRLKISKYNFAIIVFSIAVFHIFTSI